MNKQVSLLKRGIAYIVDLYLGSLMGTIPISVATYIQLGQMTQNAFLLEKSIACLVMGISMILLVFYYVIIPTKILKGQTLGKKFMDIHVCYDEESKLLKRQIIFMIFMTSFGTLVGQFLSVLTGYQIMQIVNDITMSVSLVIVAMMVFTKDHIALYDRLAKTQVQETKRSMIKNRV